MPNPALLSTAQAARELNVHRSTLTRMVQDGKIKAAARGEGIRGGMFFRAADVARAKERLKKTDTDSTSPPSDVDAAASSPKDAAAPSGAPEALPSADTPKAGAPDSHTAGAA